jgi:hypothetical protein
LGEDFQATNIPRAFAITAERLKNLKRVIQEASTASEQEKKASVITMHELQNPLEAIALPELGFDGGRKGAVAVAV